MMAKTGTEVFDKLIAKAATGDQEAAYLAKLVLKDMVGIDPVRIVPVPIVVAIHGNNVTLVR